MSTFLTDKELNFGLVVKSDNGLRVEDMTSGKTFPCLGNTRTTLLSVSASSLPWVSISPADEPNLPKEGEIVRYYPKDSAVAAWVDWTEYRRVQQQQMPEWMKR